MGLKQSRFQELLSFIVKTSQFPCNLLDSNPCKNVLISRIYKQSLKSTSDLWNPEVYLEPCQTFKIEPFEKIINDWKPVSLEIIQLSQTLLTRKF